MFYCLHAFADGNWHNWIRLNMLHFSSVALSAPYPYHLMKH